uniref:Putative resolvase domain containing protein n=2 Tax=viral metagenome TaxID=1070528 RepID=A0A6M3IPD0_9ZZZZ
MEPNEAAIYFRVSTNRQEEDGSSLESQMTACLHKAVELGYRVPDACVYQETWTGTDLMRPMLDELRALVKRHAIKALICYSTDRISRDPIHIAIIAEECEKAGVELVFVTEPLDNTPEGALIRYVKGYAAQMEWYKIRERTLRGKLTKARSGTLSWGIKLFGYDVVDKKRVINLHEAEIVRRVFNWFAAENYNLHRAAAELNRSGIPRSNGGRWSENQVYTMLANPAYCGRTFAFRYKLVPSKRLPSKNTNHRFRDRSDWIEMPNATPAIITQEIFDAAQETLKRNRLQSPRNRKHNYIFAGGRLRCGTCGHAMSGSCKKKKHGDLLYYRCICNVKSSYYKPCPQPNVRADEVEGVVWRELVKILKTPELILRELDKRTSGKKEALSDADELLLKNQLSRLSREEERYVILFGQESIDQAMFDKQISRVRQQRQSIEEKLSIIKQQQSELAAAQLHHQDLVNVLASLSDKLDNPTHEDKVRVMESLDIHVILHPTGKADIRGLIPQQGALPDIRLSRSLIQFVRFPFSIPTTIPLCSQKSTKVILYN